MQLWHNIVSLNGSASYGSIHPRWDGSGGAQVPTLLSCQGVEWRATVSFILIRKYVNEYINTHIYTQYTQLNIRQKAASSVRIMIAHPG